MTWIKIKDLMPPAHEIILFQDRFKNEHYGVLCGEFAELEKRNKFWCHIFQKYYEKKDIVYWTSIPINQYTIMKNLEFADQVNKFLWEKINNIEKSIFLEFKKQKKENPEWESEQFVNIAIRNTLWKIINLLKLIKD